MINIIADKYIPFVTHYFQNIGKVTLYDPWDINNKKIKNYNILLVRSVTKVNKQLLKNTNIICVGSMTAGKDHIDLEYLKTRNIKVFFSENANAFQVLKYIKNILKMILIFNRNIKNVGVIGCGNIGNLVSTYLKNFFSVLEYDPYKKKYDLIEDVDIIFLHASLNKSSYHIINKIFLKKQKKGCILVNASRGEIINFQDLWYYGKHLLWVFDVWYNEPYVEEKFITHSFFSTPHIAGYSIEAKKRSTEQVFQKISKFFNINKNIKIFNKYPDNNLMSYEYLLYINKIFKKEKNFSVLRRKINNEILKYCL